MFVAQACNRWNGLRKQKQFFRIEIEKSATIIPNNMKKTKKQT